MQERAQETQAMPTVEKISRRAAIKGLIGVPLAVFSASCAPFAPSSLQQGSGFRTPLAPYPTPKRPPIVGETIYTYDKHISPVNTVAWSHNGQRIASGSGDATVQIWDAPVGGNIFTYKAPAGVTSVAWSPDGTRIASGHGDGTIHIWNPITGNMQLVYSKHKLGVNSVAWSPDGKHVASGSVDKTVHVWDASTGHQYYTKSDYNSYVYWVAWSPDGKRLASASDDYTAHVWDAPTGNNQIIYRGHHREVLVVLWTPDGKRLTSGSFDATLQEWDSNTGRHILSIPAGGTHFIYAAAQSPNGQRLASGGQEQLVKAWDAASGHNLFTNSGHFVADTSSTPDHLGGTIFGLAWSPDGKYIASASHDTTVQIILAQL